MRRLGLALLVLVTLLAGCAGVKEYLPIINASIIGGKGVVLAGKTKAVEDKHLVGCYVTASLATAMDSAQQTLNSWVGTSPGSGIIPAVDVDLAACHALVEGGIKPIFPEKAKEQVKTYVTTLSPAVFAVIHAVIGAADVGCRDKVIADAVLRYVQGAIPPVIDELGTPDGKLSIPTVTLDLAGCQAEPTPPERASTMVCPSL